MSTRTDTRRRVTNTDHENEELSWDQGIVRANAGIGGYPFSSSCDHVCGNDQQVSTTDCPLHLPCCSYRPKHTNKGHSTHTTNETWEEVLCSKTTISAENEVEAQKLANNYKIELLLTFQNQHHVSSGSCFSFQNNLSVYVWVLLGYPPLVVAHGVLCVLSWLLVFTIPVAKISIRTLTNVLLIPPDHVLINDGTREGEGRAILCCYHAVNIYYYKYTVDGINVFAVNLLPLVVFSLVIGYVDHDNQFASAEVKFTTAIGSLIPLSYYIGMGIASETRCSLCLCSISAQSNFAVGAVVNATFGSITELTFYITALLRGHQQDNICLQEIVKAALTGTLLGCILFIPGICMIIGGLKHREQRFNSRSAGVSASLLFISIGGVFAPTLFSKAYGNLVCEGCTNSSGTNSSSGTFTCRNCHYDMNENNYTLFHSHVAPLVYTVSVLLPVSYIIGLLFTLKTHSHIYDIHVGDGSGKRKDTCIIERAVCYFIGVAVLAMVPEIPEIVTGIQFALQNNISLRCHFISLEVGSCIAVQVCMIQIPILILFNAFYDVGFVLIFSDLHLWASIFSVILVNYIFMDGKSDYFQGKH
ncbi:hypothetical protein QTP86_025270 [Hemibagrus guttatus]|nr:hypothetical protein QTP86_025270 [Hemibagrus guttatus]